MTSTARRYGGAEPQRLGFWAWHASEVFHWEGQWWITHCSIAEWPRRPSTFDFRYRESNRTRVAGWHGLFMGLVRQGLFLSGLPLPGDWPDGARRRGWGSGSDRNGLPDEAHDVKLAAPADTGNLGTARDRGVWPSPDDLAPVHR